MDKTKELYVGIDVETDGPCSGLNSMLSLGAASVMWSTETRKWEFSPVFSANIKPLPECKSDPKTIMGFWGKNQKAWAAATKDPETPENAMVRFRQWVASIHSMSGRRPVAVAAPAAFDYPFVRYYMMKFLGTDYPFGHSCLDMKTVASVILRSPYHDSGKRGYPKKWLSDGFEHTHIAVEDAIEQTHIFTRMLDSL